MVCDPFLFPIRCAFVVAPLTHVSRSVAGGFLPPSAPKAVNGIIAAWDWYATFCALAGVDPTDARAAAAGLPPIDSVNVWPLLSGTTTTSPRKTIEFATSVGGGPTNTSGHTAVGALLSPPYKIIVGYGPNHTIKRAGWSTYNTPNTTSGDFNLLQVCGRTPDTGCLYDVFADPSEHHNLASGMPEQWEALYAQLLKANETVYSPVRGNRSELACTAAVAAGGFWGPFQP